MVTKIAKKDKNEPKNLVIFGDGGVGKTVIAKRLQYLSYIDENPDAGTMTVTPVEDSEFNMSFEFQGSEDLHDKFYKKMTDYVATVFQTEELKLKKGDTVIQILEIV